MSSIAVLPAPTVTGVRPGRRHSVALGARPAPRAARPSARVAPVPVRSGAAPRAVRLTGRGRLLVTLIFLAVLTATFTLFGAQSAATRDPGVPTPTQTVVVSEGDTLWGIASDVGASGDIRALIHQIKELNALSSVALVEGQELAVPVVPAG